MPAKKILCLSAAHLLIAPFSAEAFIELAHLRQLRAGRLAEHPQPLEQPQRVAQSYQAGRHGAAKTPKQLLLQQLRLRLLCLRLCCHFDF